MSKTRLTLNSAIAQPVSPICNFLVHSLCSHQFCPTTFPQAFLPYVPKKLGTILLFEDPIQRILKLLDTSDIAGSADLLRNGILKAFPPKICMSWFLMRCGSRYGASLFFALDSRHVTTTSTLVTRPTLDNDPELDCEHDKRTVMHLVTAQLERRLAYWRQREQEEILKRYRMVTSI